MESDPQAPLPIGTTTGVTVADDSPWMGGPALSHGIGRYQGVN
jgi:hypothetical protein